MDRVPPFWSWLLQRAEAGVIKMPREIYGEVAGATGGLATWMGRPDVRRALTLDEVTDSVHVRQVIAQGYAADLDDVELREVGQDPFLIAAALGGVDRVVVTREVSKRSRTRQNRHIPDVCADFNVRCINDFELWRVLDFRVG